MEKSKFTPVVKMVLIALFAAISYVVLLFRIPVATQMVHAGNAVCLLAALLLGGWQGGLAGAIGMGFFDLFYYPDSLPKTLILKFLMGLIAGLIFSIHHRRRNQEDKTAPHIALGVAAGICLLLSAMFFAGSTAQSKGWFASGFLLVLGLSLLAILGFSLLTRKLTAELLFAVLGATAGVALNVAGEFVWKLVTKTLLGYHFNAAIIATLTEIPATFINGSFSVVLAVVLYVPMKKIMDMILLRRNA